MKRRVLVLDDDEDIISVITYILEENGYETKALLSGETIFDAIASFHPALVLMDVRLGDMDGREICQRIKSEMAEPPVILISASHNLKDSLNEQGAPNDFIAKPFDIDQLLFKVGEYCRP